MPIKSGRMTPQERIFAKHYAETGNGVFAAAQANYSQPATAASKNLAKPTVLAEAQRLAEEVLANEILPWATKRHLKILQDDNAPAGAHNKAVEIAYKYGLAKSDNINDKAPSEMTAVEIQARLAGLEATRQRLLSESADRAKPVLDLEAEPLDAPSVLD
jgi:phage terminase small subunit